MQRKNTIWLVDVEETRPAEKLFISVKQLELQIFNMHVILAASAEKKWWTGDRLKASGYVMPSKYKSINI